ncbi:unnamed protein product [Symbiodinium microadriaticum]|nr:unnamed protein product [Symbiodinium microadriaticum]
MLALGVLVEKVLGLVLSEVANRGFDYRQIARSLIGKAQDLTPEACDQQCLANPDCVSWQVCAPIGGGCDGCYQMRNWPEIGEKSGWFARVLEDRARTKNLTVGEHNALPSNVSMPTTTEGCKQFLLSANGGAPESDLNHSIYNRCGEMLRSTDEAKGIAVLGQHWPVSLVYNFRDPAISVPPEIEEQWKGSGNAVRQSAYQEPGGPGSVTAELHSSTNTEVLPKTPLHAFVLPFYDTNIAHGIMQMGTMNPMQNYQMQALLRPGDTVVDVGANLGSYTIPFGERVGREGKVLAFEPFRWLYQLVTANVALNGLSNVWTFNVALGERKQRFYGRPPQLRFFSSPGGAKVNYAEQDGVPGAQESMHINQAVQLYDFETDPEETLMLALDEVLSGQTDLKPPTVQSIRLIKIDVEGMETNVVLGAMNAIYQFKPIIWSENDDYFDRSDTKFLAIMEQLEYQCAKVETAPKDLMCTDKYGRGHHERLPESARWSVSYVEASKAQVRRRQEEEKTARWNAGNHDSTEFFRKMGQTMADTERFKATCRSATMASPSRQNEEKVSLEFAGSIPAAVNSLFAFRSHLVNLVHQPKGGGELTGPIMSWVKPEKTSDSSSDEGGVASTLKTTARTCCFWLKLFPPIKWMLNFFKWLFLSRQEYAVLKKARELFKTVNVDNGCCTDCPYKQLSKMERMYLHRILKDTSRWGSERKFIQTFQSQVIAMQKDDSDAGEAITEGEFCNAVLYAVQEYMEKIVNKMNSEIKKEYKKDEKLAEECLNGADGSPEWISTIIITVTRYIDIAKALADFSNTCISDDTERGFKTINADGTVDAPAGLMHLKDPVAQEQRRQAETEAATKVQAMERGRKARKQAKEVRETVEEEPSEESAPAPGSSSSLPNEGSQEVEPPPAPPLPPPPAEEEERRSASDNDNDDAFGEIEEEFSPKTDIVNPIISIVGAPATNTSAPNSRKNSRRSSEESDSGGESDASENPDDECAPSRHS